MTLRHVILASAFVLFGALAFIGVARNEAPKQTHIHVVKTIVIPHREFVHAGTER